MKNNGKYFEKKTHGLISKLNPTKQVSRNVRITGRLSQQSRELDVVLREPDDYDFIAFECKDESRVTGVPTIEAYHTKLKDVGAKHGAIVSNMSYSRGARRMASKLKIDLLNLVDTDDPAIKTKLYSLTANVRHIVRGWSVHLYTNRKHPMQLQGIDQSMLTIEVADGSRKLVKELANDEWNKIADKPLKDGQKNVVALSNLKLLISQELVPLIEIKFMFDIGVVIKKGFLDITKTEGIYDVQNHTYQSNHLTVGSFSKELFDSWETITQGQLDSSNVSAIIFTRSDLSESHAA